MLEGRGAGKGERFDGERIHAVFESKLKKSGDEWKDPDSEDYDPYRVLGVDADDDAKRIKKAFVSFYLVACST